MKKVKPIAGRISQYGNCTEIIYRCPKCGTSFAILGNKEKFCHNCGTKIDWDVYTHLKEPFTSNDYEKEKNLLAYINRENEHIREIK